MQLIKSLTLLKNNLTLGLIARDMIEMQILNNSSSFDWNNSSQENACKIEIKALLLWPPVTNPAFFSITLTLSLIIGIVRISWTSATEVNSPKKTPFLYYITLVIKFFYSYTIHVYTPMDY